MIENTRLLIDNNVSIISNLSNIIRLIYESFDHVTWCGFYLSNSEYNILELGPFQGPIACTVIPFGKGVCGTAAKSQCSQLVHNVHLYPGHIACSSTTNSELVVPIIKNDLCVGVIDLDSDKLSNFNENDMVLLESVAQFLSNLF